MEFDSVGVHSLRQLDIYNVDTSKCLTQMCGRMRLSRVCYLVLLLVSPRQELHDHHVGFGHLQDAVHLSAVNN